MFFLINRTEFTFKPFHETVIQKLQDIADCKNKKKNLLLNLPVGCITGDSLIRINRRRGLSRVIPIKKVYEHFKHIGKNKHYYWKNDLPFYTRSVFDNHICLKEVENIVYSGKKQVYLLELEDGKSLKATAEHKILTKNGYIELIKLTKNDYVAVDNLKEDYKKVCYAGKSLKFIDPKKYHIHHKDGNHYNNDISNLECLTPKEHFLKHKLVNNFGQGKIDYSKVKKITKLGIEDTYDITMKHNGQEPNFSANQIMIHNSGKSIITEFFITWTFARNPSIKHLYVSHSEQLITKLSRETLEIIESEYWQDLFNHQLDQKSSTQYNFLDAGTRSGMTAAPIGSAITGIDAGNPSILDSFNGAMCFSYDTLVWTDKGRLKIGDIVTKRLKVKVWSYNVKTKKFSFKPITHYHDNGIAQTIDFCGIRCTKDHRFYTKECWKKAKDISSIDVLFGFYYPFYLVNRYTKFVRNFFSTIMRVFKKSYIFISFIVNKFKDFLRTSMFNTIFTHYCSFNAFCSTKIKNLIKSLIIRNIFPSFNHKNAYYENVYCLSIQDNHTFFVGGYQVGLLTHNCIDDPIDVSNANSEVMLNEIIRLYTDKLKTRLRTKTTPIILIMQRLNTNDLAQYVMDAETEDWDIVVIKAYNEETKTSFWEEKYPVSMLNSIKLRTPELYYSQYQQEPRATGGSMFTKEMFRIDALPEFFDFTAIVADTAYRDTERNDYTVFCAIAKANGRLYILDIKRARINSDKIVDYFLPFINTYAHREDFIGCYIEPKGHGIYLNQYLPTIGVPIQSESIIKEFYKDRKRDKVIRANVVLPDISNFGITFNCNMDKGVIQDCIQEALEFPDGKHDDFCLTGDTLISTLTGDIPIKDIKIGDWLITPLGLSRVENCGITGYKETIIKYGIEATENHKIFDKESDKFIRIKYDVSVDKLSYGGLIKWKYLKLLFLMEKNMLLWGRNAIISIHQLQIKEESVLKDFIEKFWNFITKKKFLNALLFTTKMVTLLITTSLTWNVYQRNNILKNINNLLLKGVKLLNILNILKKLENLQKNGTKAKKAENGIVNMQKKSFNQKNNLSCAQIVEEPLIKLNQTKQIMQKKDVYNITTKAGCYYANGILVSNCDTLTDSAKLVYKHIPSILEVI